MPTSLRRPKPPTAGDGEPAPVTSEVKAPASNTARASGSPTQGAPDQVSALADLMGLNEQPAQAVTPAEAPPRAAATAPQGKALGAWDSMTALWGGLHLSKVMPADAGVKWDQSNKDANYLNYDVWGNNKARVGALRLSSLDNGSLRTGAVSADNAQLEQVKQTRNKDGSKQHQARLTLPTATARAVQHAGLDISADAVRIQGVAADRSYTAESWESGFFSAPGATAVSVGSVSVEGLKVGGVAIEDLSARQLAATVDERSASATIEQASASGVQALGGTINEVSASQARLGGQLDGSRSSATLARAEATGIALPGIQAAKVYGQDLSANKDTDGTRVAARRLSASALTAGGVSASEASVDGVAGDLTATGNTATFDHANARGLTLPGGSVGQLDARRGLLMQVPDGRVGAAAQEAEAREVDVGGVTAPTVTARDLLAAQVGEETRLRVGSAEAPSVAWQGGSAGQTSLQGARATLRGDQLSAGVDAAQVSGVEAGAVGIDQLGATGLRADRSGEVLTGGADTVRAEGLRAGESSAQTAAASGVEVHRAPSLTRLKARNAEATALRAPGTPVGDLTAARASVDEVQVQTGKETVLSGSNARLAQVSARRSAAPGGSSDPDLLPQVADRVGSADLQARVGLNPGTTGEGLDAATIRPGTTAHARVQVANGAIRPSGTRVDLSRDIDTFGWTSVRGAYIQPKGEVMADVAGWGDKNITPQLGLTGVGDRLPLRVGDLARRLPAQQESSGPSPISEVHAAGTVGLTPGTVQTDGLQATLGAGNQAKVQYDQKGSETELGLSIARLLLDSLGVQAGDAALKVDGVAGSDVQHQQKTTASGTSSTTSAAELSARQVQARLPGQR